MLLEVIKNLIQSSEDFFEFIYYHKKVFKGKPRGMGRGKCIFTFHFDLKTLILKE